VNPTCKSNKSSSTYRKPTSTYPEKSFEVWASEKIALRKLNRGRQSVFIGKELTRQKKTEVTEAWKYSQPVSRTKARQFEKDRACFLLARKFNFYCVPTSEAELGSFFFRSP